MRVDIVGAGAVGLALAGRLATRWMATGAASAPTGPRDRAALLATNIRPTIGLRTRTAAQSQALNERGYWLIEGQTSTPVRIEAVAPHQSTTPADVLVVAVKCPDTAMAINDHRAAVSDETLVVSLQNGLGTEAILRQAYGRRVAMGVTRLAAHRVAVWPDPTPPPGLARPLGLEGLTPQPAQAVRLVAAGQTWLGPLTPTTDSANQAGAVHPPPRCEAHRQTLIAAMTAAGLPTESADPIAPRLWRKLLANAAINGPAALANCRNGHLASTASGVALMTELVTEGLAVAAAEGLPSLWPHAGAALEEVLALARATADNWCSMAADRRSGRAGPQTEIDFINGAIVSAADRHGLAVPVNRTVWRLMATSQPIGGSPPASASLYQPLPIPE